MHLQTSALVLTLSTLVYTASPPCTIPPTQIINFHWHNSTHNCGCDDGGCLPTGLHGGPGCGPPDTLQATFIEPSLGYNTTCYALDPGTMPAQVIPGGPYPCRSAGRRWCFSEHGETGTVTFIEPNVYCPNDERYLVTYRGSFEMNCSVDSFGNSTCVQRHGVDLLPAVDFRQ